ncbi:MAG: putative molybdenum carrier protein [Gemmatimonadota bacterium]
MKPKRIVSGGQTGVDRAALDVALELGVSCGGWVPKGRIDERGRIPERYPGLRETATADWSERTEANVRDSEGTLIISRGALTGGSKYTREVAKRLGRPCLHLDLARSRTAALDVARDWIARNEISVLNVAGPRASKDPGLYDPAADLLRGLFD